MRCFFQFTYSSLSLPFLCLLIAVGGDDADEEAPAKKPKKKKKKKSKEAAAKSSSERVYNFESLITGRKEMVSDTGQGV